MYTLIWYSWLPFLFSLYKCTNRIINRTGQADRQRERERERERKRKRERAGEGDRATAPCNRWHRLVVRWCYSLAMCSVSMRGKWEPTGTVWKNYEALSRWLFLMFSGSFSKFKVSWMSHSHVTSRFLGNLDKSLYYSFVNAPSVRKKYQLEPWSTGAWHCAVWMVERCSKSTWVFVVKEWDSILRKPDSCCLPQQHEAVTVLRTMNQGAHKKRGLPMSFSVEE